MNKVLEVLKEDLDVKMGSKECREWQKNHPNCHGCPTEEACEEWLSRIMQYSHAVIYGEENEF